MNLRAKELHPRDVRRLPADVFAPHIDLAFKAKERACRRRRDAVLTGARLGDDARLPHPLREQHLPDGVIHLMRAGMAEIFALQPDARAELFGEVLRVVERSGPPDIMLKEIV